MPPKPVRRSDARQDLHRQPDLGIPPRQTGTGRAPVDRSSPRETDGTEQSGHSGRVAERSDMTTGRLILERRSSFFGRIQWLSMGDVVSTRTRSRRPVFLHDSLRVERVNSRDTALQPGYCELRFIERQGGRLPRCWRGATGHDPRRMTQGPVDRFSKAVRKTCVDPTRRMPFLLGFQGMAEGFSAPWGIGASLEIPGLYPRNARSRSGVLALGGAHPRPCADRPIPRASGNCF